MSKKISKTTKTSLRVFVGAACCVMAQTFAAAPADVKLTLIND